MGYSIVARQTSEGGVDSERYQVVDDDGREYCRNAGGGVEATPWFSLAVECYREVSGDNRIEAEGFDYLEIDGVRQEPA